MGGCVKWKGDETARPPEAQVLPDRARAWLVLLLQGAALLASTESVQPPASATHLSFWQRTTSCSTVGLNATQRRTACSYLSGLQRAPS